MRLATAACPRWRRRRRWRRSPPGTEEVAAGVGEAPEAGSSISNLALVVPPTVVNNRDAEDPAFLACWRSSSSAASIFGAQNLNLKMAGKEFTVASHNLAQVRSRLRSDPDWGPIQTCDIFLFCFWVSRRWWRGLLRLFPAEPVEHVEERHHHVDEDYQREQGICNGRVPLLSCFTKSSFAKQR